MKKYNKLKRFPLGAIQADGFLRDQLLRGKDGMAGHLWELEPGMIADPFVRKTVVDQWQSGDQLGWGAEISGNYWSGYIRHAFVLNDADMIARATEWVNTMMKRQRPDGYLGTYDEKGADIYDDYNAWGTACALRGLLAFWEATGREDVLDAVHRCLLWFCETWVGDKKTVYGGPKIIDPLIYCYWYTGDERLLDFAEEYAEFNCEHDIFSNSYRSFLEKDFQYQSNHTAGIGNALRLPALLYAATGKEIYLRAGERMLELLRKKAMHLSGGPVSCSEYLGPVGSTTESEYCSFTFYQITYSAYSFITGEAKYGDYMEQMFYNAAQGARKKDEKAIAYMSAPNQIYATTISSDTGGDWQVYAPCYPVSCCPVNAVAVVPEFVSSMLLTDEESNVYVTMYGPCRLKHGELALRMETRYPFRNRVTIYVEGEGERSLFLRIPMWSEGYTVTVNGKKIPVYKNELGYAELRRNWKMGDQVDICFEASVQIIRVDDSDCAAKYPMAFQYGALLFSYHVPERWKEIKGHPVTPLPEGWSWYDVKPVYQEPNGSDAHENIGNRRHAYSWNVAVDENLRSEQISVEVVDTEGYVWETAPLRLHLPCYKALYLCATYPHKTFEPFGAKQPVTNPLELVLEPYGCTNLRVTYFPIADIKNDK